MFYCVLVAYSRIYKLPKNFQISFIRMVKVASILLFSLLYCAVTPQKKCMEDYNNQCKTHSDCCSRNCERGDPSWATGVCKPRSGGNGGNTGGGGSRLVTRDEFDRAVRSTGAPTPRQDQYNGFVNGLSKGEISTKREAAMFLAQIIHESGGLRYKEEIACKDSKCPSDYRDGRCDQPGQYYYGRGYMQLSWCYNYRDAGQGLGLGNTLLNNPDLVASNEQYSWDTSFWFWKTNVRNGQYRSQVRNGQFGYSTRAINGEKECTGSNIDKSKRRFQFYQSVFREFGVSGTPMENGCYN